MKNFGFAVENRSGPRLWECEEPARQTSPIIEIMHDARRDRYRIVRNGFFAISGPAATAAIEEVMNKMLDVNSRNASEEARRRLKQMIDRVYTHQVDMKQLSEDKAWPIFWACMMIDKPRFMPNTEYRRDNAREVIREFCTIFGLTRADWAWLCNKSHYYLYWLFDLPPGFQRIRWPEHLMSVVGPQLRDHRRFQDWLKEYFINHDGIMVRPEEFTYILRDVFDAEMAGLNLGNVYRAKEWTDFCRRLHDVEGRRNRLYGGYDPAGRTDLTAYTVHTERMRNFIIPPRGEMTFRPGRVGPSQEEIAWLNECRNRIEHEIIQSFMVPERDLSTAADGPGTTIDAAALIRAREMLMRAPQPPASTAEIAQRALEALRVQGVSDDQINQYMNHVMTYGMGSLRIDESRPRTIEVYEWMKSLPQEIVMDGGFRAELLGTNDKVWVEADRMKHCLYRSYLSRMKDEGYVAYHVTAIHLGPEHMGFTLGFVRKVKDPYTIPVNKKLEKSDFHWGMDQIRGFKNAFNRDTSVDKFVTFIGERLNEVKNG